MSEKVVPAIKKVPKADGLKQGSAHTTITTPNDVANKVGWNTGEQTGSMFGRK